MITGLNKAWLEVLIGAFYEQASALSARGNNWGILVKDDITACRYQVANYRQCRASKALRGHGICKEALSLQKDGWADVTKSNNDNFMQSVRKRAIKAKQILNEYYKEQQYDHSDPR